MSVCVCVSGVCVTPSLVINGFDDLSVVHPVFKGCVVTVVVNVFY